MIIILDVETISKKYQCISDIAWLTVDRNKPTKAVNYIPQEHLSLMAEGEFSQPKMAATMQEVAKGRAVIMPYDEIMENLMEDFTKARYIYAYNASFDKNAITRTCKALQSRYTEFFEMGEIVNKWRDLWAWASNTILYKKSFIDFCEAHGLRTPKGYCSTSAETVLKFLRNDPTYVEQHTALEDIQDEFQIYLAIKKEIKREYTEILEDDLDFRGKPFFTIAKLEKAMNG